MGMDPKILDNRDYSYLYLNIWSVKARKTNKKGGKHSMNKSQLIDAIADKTKLTKKDIGDVLEAFMDTVMDTVNKGDSVTLTGFGTFKSMHRKARTGRNPQTGESIQIPARDVPVFRPGKSFKELLKS
jgi:DNA-binding protein HU-beta